MEKDLLEQRWGQEKSWSSSISEYNTVYEYKIVATRHLESLPALQSEANSFWGFIFGETISDLGPHANPPVCDSATRCRALENQLTSDTRAYEEQTVFGIQWWVSQ